MRFIGIFLCMKEAFWKKKGRSLYALASRRQQDEFRKTIRFVPVCRNIEAEFRLRAFAEQRRLLARPLRYIALVLVITSLAFVVTVGWGVTNVILILLYVGSLWLSMSELLGGRAGHSEDTQSLRTMEHGSCAAMMVAVGIGYPAWLTLLHLNPMEIAHNFGTCVFWSKAFLITLQYGDVCFWILQVTDSTLYVLVGHVILRGNVGFFPFVAGAVNHCLVAWGLRRLWSHTMIKLVEEMEKRQTAENNLKRFMAYTMHEMRNPLSGATLLTAEFIETLKTIIDECTNAPDPKCVYSLSLPITQKSEQREGLVFDLTNLSELVRMMARQLTKMKGVCDDVLNLERLESGRFPFIFKPENVRVWFLHLAGESGRMFDGPRAHPLFVFSPAGRRSVKKRPSVGEIELGQRAGTVFFTSSWDDPSDKEAQKVLSKYSIGTADFLRLEQVVVNLLSNARKFTPEGGSVHLRGQLSIATLEELKRAKREKKKEKEKEKEKEGQRTEEKERGPEGEEEMWGVLQVSVKDSGSGLRASDIPSLFRPYSQVRAGELQNGGGTGLGLCVCRSFVEAHQGGRIWVQSEGLGRGSEFFFEILLPLQRNSEGTTVDQRESKKEEQGEDETERTEEAKEEDDKGTEGETEKKEEDTQTKESAPLFFPQGVLDNKSPPRGEQGGQDGKGGDRNGQKTLDERENRGGSTQADIKPMEDSTLEVREKSPCFPESVDVLLVDDDRFCLLASSVVLRRMGYSTLSAESGEEAIKLVCGVCDENGQRAPPLHRFSLILLDNNMPGLTGPETAVKIREHFRLLEGGDETEAVENKEQTLREKGGAEQEKEKANERLGLNGRESGSHCLPLMVGCTGETSEATREAFMASGAVRVLHKPVRREDLEDLLTK
uniref:histidine kinase n=1 Tax=Chromera velia CCMP2878 TaxID=1169474 RepID=A0A0G4I136_9ALVE|eukprot:Cvel_10061.t1-p1 / transcript=Cvel_10061.t1 / gene=Cvel_10061 / organism=Chromera_velia_CCMP2878 / gene_product=Ethylene receptor, putative / transcript_product=Ethylene receptor, putative / location=Cvel_scaffold598:62536-68467(+) / protein_length=888 / sequence_SO=supercontig / SO=protein_coding / is_pseudo=false